MGTREELIAALRARLAKAATTEDLASVLEPRTLDEAQRLAEMLDDDRGTLNVGATADVAILELREGAFEFLDNYKSTRTGKQRLFPIATVLAGKQTPGRA